jgi:amidase
VTAGAHVIARYLRGIADDVETSMPHPERLERRTRGMARMGRLLSEGTMAKVRAQEPALRAAVDDVLRDADVILMPGAADGPTRIGAYHGRSALWTLNAVAMRHPFTGLFNATGHPSASVPMGFDADHLPVGVQLAGPHGSEALLLSLSGQVEAARPWADERPPLA